MTKTNSFRSNGNTMVAPVTPADLGQTSQRRKDGDNDAQTWADYGVGHVRSRKDGNGCIHGCPGGTGGCANCPVSR